MKFVATYVPGKGATEFYQAFSDQPHFYHEENAYTVAHGASLRGTPAICFIKSHGAAKALNSIVASLYAGVGAPMVTFIFEDLEGVSSDHPFAAFNLMKSLDAHLFNDLSSAFEFSLANHKPAFICLDSARNPENLKKDWLELCLKNANQFKAVATHQALLNPLLSSRYFKELTSLPSCPNDLPPFLRATAESYEPTIEYLKKLRYDWVTGDAGTSSLFGLPPHNFIKVCTHMGGALPLALGAKLGGSQRVLAVTGDFSFMSTGGLVLTECLRRNIALDVVIFHNQKAQATGGQKVRTQDVLLQIPVGVEVITNVELLKLPSEVLRLCLIHI